ncbi:hypothetical protein FQA39_LY07536 [Lamprigera yunnana]|nr:hypothetical protein FQA39_LY07536 [Lamprigera yunnana]
MGKKPQISKRNKKKAPLSSEDEDEEDWIESGDSLDDIVINEVTDQETDDIIFQHWEKSMLQKILQVLEGDDFKVQCLKTLDETKTTFKFIENVQCVIAKKEILGRLPDPQLFQKPEGQKPEGQKQPVTDQEES